MKATRWATYEVGDNRFLVSEKGEVINLDKLRTVLPRMITQGFWGFSLNGRGEVHLASLVARAFNAPGATHEPRWLAYKDKNIRNCALTNLEFVGIEYFQNENPS